MIDVAMLREEPDRIRESQQRRGLDPSSVDHAVARLGRRAGMADTLIGVTGDFVPARRVLNPLFLARMLV